MGDGYKQALWCKGMSEKSIYAFKCIWMWISILYKEDTDTERALLPTVSSSPDVLKTVAAFDAPNYVLSIKCRN